MTTYYVFNNNNNMCFQTLRSAVSWPPVSLSSLTSAPLTVYVWQQHVCAAARWGRDGVRGREGDRSGELDNRTHRHTFHFLILVCYWCFCVHIGWGVNVWLKDIFHRVSCWYQTCVLLMGCGPGSLPGCAWYYKAISQLKYLDILYFGYSWFLSGKAL